MSTNKRELKTLIVYESKYGCTEKCAQLIQEKIKNTEIVNVKNAPEDIGFYDTIIIGGSIYMGKIQRQIKAFCRRHVKVLAKKRMGLFICCMFTGEKAKQQLINSFPKELTEVAIAKDCFGGEISYNKMKLLDRIIIKLVTKSPESEIPKLDKQNNASNLSIEKIDYFVSTLL
ncbi:MAG: flavodoxin domain-containing protein [Bacilli bacterium]|nr:flavodoxin domain-containing protein [Bacilli bacterium]